MNTDANVQSTKQGWNTRKEKKNITGHVSVHHNLLLFRQKESYCHLSTTMIHSYWTCCSSSLVTNLFASTPPFDNAIAPMIACKHSTAMVSMPD